MSSAKSTKDAKKDEFRNYLEKAAVLELLTKSLVQLYEEPEPNDALTYLQKPAGGSEDDTRVIEKLKAENSKLKAKVCFQLVCIGLIRYLYVRWLRWKPASPKVILLPTYVFSYFLFNSQ